MSLQCVNFGFRNQFNSVAGNYMGTVSRGLRFEPSLVHVEFSYSDILYLPIIGVDG